MRKKCLFLALAMTLAVSAAAAVEVSTKNNIGGHFEYAGFTVVPVSDAAPAYSSDLSRAKVFEIIRPGQQSFSVGRLYTSCTCIQVEIEKKSFYAGERALVTLRNVQPTEGQNYPFYIQISSPVRAVLRHDTFVISDRYSGASSAAASFSEGVDTTFVPPALPVAVQAPMPTTFFDDDAASSVAAPEAVSSGSDYMLSDKDLF